MKKYIPSVVLGLLLVSGIIFIFQSKVFALTYYPPALQNFIPKTVILNLIQDPDSQILDSSFRWNDKKIVIPNQAAVVSNQAVVIPNQKIVIPNSIWDPDRQTASIIPYFLRQLQKPIDLAQEFIQSWLFGGSDDVAAIPNQVVVVPNQLAGIPNQKIVIPDLIRDPDSQMVASSFRNSKTRNLAISLLQIQPLPLQDKANELLQNLQQYKTEFIQAPVPAEFRQAPSASNNVAPSQTVVEVDTLISRLNSLLDRINSNADHTARSLKEAVDDLLKSSPKPTEVAFPIPQPTTGVVQQQPTQLTSPVTTQIVERVIERQPIIQEIKLNIPSLPAGYFAGIQGGVPQSINQQIIRETVVETRTVTDNSAVNALSQSMQQQFSALQQIISQSAPTAGNLSITDSDVPDNITVNKYLPLAGGNLYGNLTVATSSAGFGTSSPGTVLAVKGESDFAGIAVFENHLRTSYLISTSTTASGFATTSPWGTLAIEHITSGDEDLAAFVVSDSGTSTPSFIVMNGTGFVGVGTNTPGATFGVTGDAVISGNVIFNNLDIQGTCTGCVSASGGGWTDSGTVVVLQTSTDYVGVGTDTPYAPLAVEQQNSGDEDLAAFVVSDSGSTSPAFIVLNGTGNVGLGTTSPLSHQLSLSNQLLVGGTGTSTFEGGLLISTAAGNVGIGTDSPSYTLSVAGNLLLGGAATNTFENGIKLNTGCFLLPNGTCAGDVASFSNITEVTDFISISSPASTTPYAVLGIEQITSGDEDLAAFVVSDSGSTSPAFIVLNGTGNVGLGTTSPLSHQLSLSNQLLVGGTGTSTFEGGLLISTAAGNVGIGTDSPSYTLSVAGNLLLGGAATNTFENGIKLNTGCFLLPNGTCAGDVASFSNITEVTDFISISSPASATPYAILGIEQITSGDEDLAAFVVSDTGTKTPSFIVLNGTGFVGIGTNTPLSHQLSIANQLLVGGTGTSTFEGGLLISTAAGNVGIGTDSPSYTLSVAGNLLLGGAATNTFESGIKLNTGCFLMPNGTCAGDVASFSNIIEVTDFISISSPASTTPYAVLGIEQITSGDEDLAAFVVSDSGSTSPAFIVLNGTGDVGVGTNTPGSRFSVQGLANLGSLYVEGETRTSFLVSTSTTASTFAGQITTSGTAGVGVGTATPGASQFGVNEGWTSVLSGDAYIYGQLTLPYLVSTSTTNSGFASSTPWGVLSVEQITSGDELLPAFVVGDTGTKTPSFIVLNGTGFVGVATNTPGATLGVTGDAIVSGNVTINNLDIQGTCVGCGGQAIGGGWTDNGTTITLNTATDDVGVGTDTPTVKLEVAGFGLFKGGLYVQATTTTSSLIATSTLEVRGNGGSALPDFNVVDGVVGVGTSSPGNRFDVAGNGLFKGGLYVQATTTTSSLIATSTLEVRGAGGAGTPDFVVLDGLVGYATATPWASFAIEHINSSSVDYPAFVVSDNGTSTASLIVLNHNGYVGVGTNTPWGVLSVEIPAISDEQAIAFVVGDEGSSTPALAVYASGITTIENLQTGTLSFDTNAGAVTWFDLPVTTGAVWGTVESYTAQIDASSTLTVYAESDGEGGVFREKVGIASTTPGAVLAITAASTTPALYIDTDSTSSFIILGNGNTGIGTETPEAVFSVSTSGRTVPAILIDASGSGDGNVAISVESGDVCVDSAADGACVLNDLAELFPTSEPMEAGDIAMFDSEKPLHLKKARNTGTSNLSTSDVHRLAGIISTSPAIVFEGSGLKALGGVYKPGSDEAPLTLSGRVPVKINLENGPIAIGDPITLSSVVGVGTKAVQTGRIIGYALENLNQATTTPGIYDKITVLVNNGYWIGPNLSSGTSGTSGDFADQSWLASLFDAVANWLKSAVATIKEIITDKITTKQLCVGDTCVTEEQLKALLLNANLNSSGISDVPNIDTITPVITLTGANPAIIDKGSVYSDQGAMVTDNVNQNLGYKIKLDDGPEIYSNELILDTSVAGEHIITYIAVDQAGNIGTAVRTVNVVDPNAAVTPPVEEPTP